MNVIFMPNKTVFEFLEGRTTILFTVPYPLLLYCKHLQDHFCCLSGTLANSTF